MTEERELQDLGWCIVEIFGHRKLGAQCREVPLAGGVMLRCDIPGGEGVEPFTQFYGVSALFAISPCSEVAARAIAARYTQPPIQRYELPAPRIAEPDPREDMDPAADFYDDVEEGDF